jgi:hypothetical protein
MVVVERQERLEGSERAGWNFESAFSNGLTDS